MMLHQRCGAPAAAAPAGRPAAAVARRRPAPRRRAAVVAAAAAAAPKLDIGELRRAAEAVAAAGAAVVLAAAERPKQISVKTTIGDIVTETDAAAEAACIAAIEALYPGCEAAVFGWPGTLAIREGAAAARRGRRSSPLQRRPPAILSPSPPLSLLLCTGTPSWARRAA